MTQLNSMEKSLSHPSKSADASKGGGDQLKYMAETIKRLKVIFFWFYVFFFEAFVKKLEILAYFSDSRWRVNHV